MNPILFAVLGGVIAVILYIVVTFFLRTARPAKTAEQGIWNAVYCIQLRQYQKALTILEQVEQEFGMTPEVMSTFCIQKASALRSLERYEEAADSYDLLLDALQNANRRIVQNDEFLAEIRQCYAACGREADFEKWALFFENLPEWAEIAFRPATEEDLDRIEEIYNSIHTAEENGGCTTGWKRNIYPTRATAEEALAQKELYVETADGTVVAAARINKIQVDVYDQIQWSHPADADQVLVIHTLVVDPAEQGKSYGKNFVEYYEDLADTKDCTCLRLDTNARNTAARSFYKKLGYTEAGILPCTFNGLEGVQLVCLEKKL